MIDRIFSVVLTFAVLIGSTLAIGSELYSAQAGADRATYELPRVVITGSIQQETLLARQEASTVAR